MSAQRKAFPFILGDENDAIALVMTRIKQKRGDDDNKIVMAFGGVL